MLLTHIWWFFLLFYLTILFYYFLGKFLRQLFDSILNSFHSFFLSSKFRAPSTFNLIFRIKLFAYRFLDGFWQTWPLFVSLKRGYYYFSSVSYRMHAKEILRTCKSTRVNNTAQSKWKSRHTEIFFFPVCLLFEDTLNLKKDVKSNRHSSN